MQKRYLIITVLILACLLVGGVALLTSDEPPSQSSKPKPAEQESKTDTLENVAHSQEAEGKANFSIVSKPINTQPDDKVLTVEPVKLEHPLDPTAVSSLARTMAAGDSRTPTIGEFVPEVLPSAEQIADPDLYLEYEQNQERRLHQAWVASAGKKIEQVEEFVQMAESRYLDPQELEEGLRKLEALKTMQKQLQNQLEEQSHGSLEGQP